MEGSGGLGKIRGMLRFDGFPLSIFFCCFTFPLSSTRSDRHFHKFTYNMLHIYSVLYHSDSFSTHVLLTTDLSNEKTSHRNIQTTVY